MNQSDNKPLFKMEIAKTPEPPYYAVIFTSLLNEQQMSLIF